MLAQMIVSTRIAVPASSSVNRRPSGGGDGGSGGGSGRSRVTRDSSPRVRAAQADCTRVSNSCRSSCPAATARRSFSWTAARSGSDTRSSSGCTGSITRRSWHRGRPPWEVRRAVRRPCPRRRGWPSGAGWDDPAGMLGLLVQTYRLVRVVVLLVRQPEGRSLSLLVVVQLVGGTVFYSLQGGWSWRDALYFSVTTLATVGLGDDAQANDAGKVFTIVFILTGVGLLATFIS